MKKNFKNRLLSMEYGSQKATNGHVGHRENDQYSSDNEAVAIELSTTYDFEMDETQVPWGNDDDKFQANIVLEAWNEQLTQKRGSSISFTNYGAPAKTFNLPDSKGAVKLSVEFNLIYDSNWPMNWDYHTGKIDVFGFYETNRLGEINFTVA